MRGTETDQRRQAGYGTGLIGNKKYNESMTGTSALVFGRNSISQ